MPNAKSDKCWFKDLCKNKLCQYAHDINENTTNDTTENVPLDKAAESNDDKNTTENIEISNDLDEDVSNQPKIQQQN
jgi:hypothetical protein